MFAGKMQERQFGSSAVRQFGSSAVRRFGDSAVRRFGGSAVRWWVGIAKSMKATNSPSLLLDFRSLRNDFSIVLGKFDADLRSLELFWFEVSFFCRFSAMLGKAWQQDGAKWTKLGPSWQQVAAKSCQDAAKIASLVTL